MKIVKFVKVGLDKKSSAREIPRNYKRRKIKRSRLISIEAVLDAVKENSSVSTIVLTID